MPDPLDPITRDFYEERRRKWRRSAFWRGFLVAAVDKARRQIPIRVRQPFGPNPSLIE